MSNKTQYIEALKKVKTTGDWRDIEENLEKCIIQLPSCYAKGYLQALYNQDYNCEDWEGRKSEMLDWANYDIWKPNEY